MNETKAIIITQENIGSVLFQDVRFTVDKYSNLRGVDDKEATKYEYQYEIIWNGAMVDTMLEQASMHQATNEYNNTRPSNDLKIMAASECLRKTDAMIKLSESGVPKLVEAISERARGKKVTDNEIVTSLADKNLAPEKRKYYEALRDARMVTLNAKLAIMTAAIK